MKKESGNSTVRTTLLLCVIGLVLIIAGMAIDKKILNIKIQDVCSNLGALFLIIGTLQWFFDENSRQGLMDQINERLDQRERLRTLGVDRGLKNSKEIGAEDQDVSDLKNAERVVIGVHYSDGTIVRFENVIRSRLEKKKVTQILHSDPAGTKAKHFLENSLATPVNLQVKIGQFKQVMNSKFSADPNLQLIAHDRVLRYSFVYCEKFIWIIFMTNSSAYVPQVPALKVHAGTPLFNFFFEDIRGLGATL